MSGNSENISRHFIDAAEAVTAAIAHHIKKHKLAAINNYVDLADLHDSITGVCAVPYKSIVPVFHSRMSERDRDEQDLYSVFVYINDYERAEVTFDTPVGRNEALIMAKEIMNEYGGMDILSDMPFIAMKKGSIGGAYLRKGLTDLYLSVVDSKGRIYETRSILLPKRSIASALCKQVNGALEEPQSGLQKAAGTVTYLPFARPVAE